MESRIRAQLIAQKAIERSTRVSGQMRDRVGAKGDVLEIPTGVLRRMFPAPGDLTQALKLIQFVREHKRI